MRLILPNLKPCLLDMTKIKDIAQSRRYQDTLYASNGVFRREAGSLRRVIPIDEDIVAVNLGGIDMCIDGSTWRTMDEDPLVSPDFVTVRRVLNTCTLLLDPKVEFTTETDETGSVVDAYFVLGADSVLDGCVKAEAEEQVLTLLSKLNFC